jgi:hypothetical protein
MKMLIASIAVHGVIPKALYEHQAVLANFRQLMLYT